MPNAARVSREQDSRAATAKPAWKPLDQYPLPVVDGLRFRWLSSVQQDGTPDSRNLSRRFREGWVPTKATDHPELQLRSDERSQFPEGIEIEGMLLCQIAQGVVDSRNDYYRRVTDQQMTSVDNSMFKMNDKGDHGMQILKPKRRSRVAVGKQAESDSDSAED